jgi:hypothetical protein
MQEPEDADAYTEQHSDVCLNFKTFLIWVELLQVQLSTTESPSTRCEFDEILPQPHPSMLYN